MRTNYFNIKYTQHIQFIKQGVAFNFNNNKM